MRKRIAFVVLLGALPFGFFFWALWVFVFHLPTVLLILAIPVGLFILLAIGFGVGGFSGALSSWFHGTAKAMFGEPKDTGGSCEEDYVSLTRSADARWNEVRALSGEIAAIRKGDLREAALDLVVAREATEGGADTKDCVRRIKNIKGDISRWEYRKGLYLYDIKDEE